MSIREIFQWIVGILFGLTSVFTVAMPTQLALMTTGKVRDVLPVAGDFVPAVRLVTFTDSHNRNDNVGNAIDAAYRLFDEDNTYPGIDAFIGLGDFTSIGGEDDYRRYAETLREHVKDDTLMINIHGNHEFKDDNYREFFLKYFGHEPDTVTEINGFSCIAFSGVRSMTEWTFTPESLVWLDNAISRAEKTADGKAVFVFQHPHIWGTVFPSAFWSDPQLNPVFVKHPGVVDFSGHSHFPLNDPRSIYQSTYTAVGCGAMATFDLDKNGIPGQYPDGFDKAAQICVIEADNDGSVRIRGYDVFSLTCICDYYIEDVNDQSTYSYTQVNRIAHDTAPVFAAETKASARKNENGEWVLSFDEAKAAEGYVVHSYKITISDDRGLPVFAGTFVNDYYVFDDDNTADFRIPGDKLRTGNAYSLTVVAESAYHKYSGPLKLSFIAE